MNEKRKSSVWFGCLVKGPLGCFAFLFGSFVVLVLFLPFTIGELLTSDISESFSRRRAGTLEFGDAWFGSFYGDQEVAGIVLRDPDGVEILHGSMRAPSFATLFAEPPSWGPIELHVGSVSLERDADGTTNLERALALADATGEAPVRDLATGFEFERLEMLVTLERVSWSDARGRECIAQDLTGTLDWVDRGDTVDVEGTLEGDLVGIEGGTVLLSFAIEGLGGLADEPLVWSATLRATASPSALVFAVAPWLDDAGVTLDSIVRDVELQIASGETPTRLVVAGEDLSPAPGDDGSTGG